MRIKESKNLKCEKLSWAGPSEGPDDFDPKECLLESFSRPNDKLVLYFKNRTQATIKAKNITGGKEIDLIEESLGEYLGKSYEEVLNINF